ncbi:MAG: UDP-2,3-diacylglucosamine diphosphatase LpxI [Cohaesibacter sp.]|nr:UDP-2,3-diacylglucosamine diphosphatase LpxI [Cohaesibacter sp.]
MGPEPKAMIARLDGPVGIIAGGQSLPLEIAQKLRHQDKDYILFGLAGEADRAIEVHPHYWLKWGEIGRMFKLFEQHGIRHLLCIGSVTKRPDFKSIRLDLGAVKALPEILRIMSSGGDEGVLGGVASFMEKRGITLLSVPDVTPELVIGDQFSLNPSLAEKLAGDIDLAAKAALMVGQLDAGQGAVVAAGRILALEGPEGTDQMLARVCEIRAQKRARWAFGTQGVLLKRARPGQDLRFDMPTIGPKTLQSVKAAGLAGLVCAQGEVLCAEHEKVQKIAEREGLFVIAKSLTHSLEGKR